MARRTSYKTYKSYKRLSEADIRAALMSNLKDKVMLYLEFFARKPDEKYSWNVYSWALELIGHMNRELNLSYIYDEQIKEIEEKLKKLLVGARVEVTKFEIERLQHIVGTEGVIKDIKYHTRNRPQLFVEWIYREDDESKDELYSGDPIRGWGLHRGPLPTTIKADDWYLYPYEIELVEPTTIEDVRAALDETNL